MMTVSPGLTSRAAAPLMQIWPLPRCALDGVGRQPRAVVDVEHVHLLERQDVGRVHQVGDRW